MTAAPPPIPLLPATLDQWSFTSPFEGVIKHLYLDSEGLPTCGVGFLVATEDACSKLPWQPSVQAALADWRLVKSQPKGFAAKHYAAFCKASLSNQSMRLLFTMRVNEFRRQIADWHLERYPLEAQIALLDLAYNLGPGGLAKYAKLRAALERRNWVAAAEECSRRGVQQRRNDATRALFLRLVEDGR